MADRPLLSIAHSFKDLALQLTNDKEAGTKVELQLHPFAKACALVSILFGSLGFAFKFAEKDYVSKVDDLLEASKNFENLNLLVEADCKSDCVRRGGSHSRNLLRVKRGLDMVKVLFEHILRSQDVSLRNSASVAYEKVFAPHHPWAIRKAVSAGMYTLPSTAQFAKKLNETEETARAQMLEYVNAATLVIAYVEGLFLSRNLGLDW